MYTTFEAKKLGKNDFKGQHSVSLIFPTQNLMTTPENSPVHFCFWALHLG